MNPGLGVWVNGKGWIRENGVEAGRTAQALAGRLAVEVVVPGHDEVGHDAVEQRECLVGDNRFLNASFLDDVADVRDELHVERLHRVADPFELRAEDLRKIGGVALRVRHDNQAEFVLRRINGDGKARRHHRVVRGVESRARCGRRDARDRDDAQPGVHHGSVH